MVQASNDKSAILGRAVSASPGYGYGFGFGFNLTFVFNRLPVYDYVCLRTTTFAFVFSSGAEGLLAEEEMAEVLKKHFPPQYVTGLVTHLMGKYYEYNVRLPSCQRYARGALILTNSKLAYTKP